MEKEQVYENSEKNSVTTIGCGKGCKERSPGGWKQDKVKEKKKKKKTWSLIAWDTTTRDTTHPGSRERQDLRQHSSASVPLHAVLQFDAPCAPLPLLQA